LAELVVAALLTPASDSLAQMQIPAEAKVVPFPHLTSFYPNPQDSPLHALVHHRLDEALGSECLHFMLEFKWQKFARRRFFFKMFLHCLLLLLFVVRTVLNLQDSDFSDKNSRVGGRIFIDVCLTLLGLQMLVYEMKQLYTEGVNYLKKMWNYVDFLAASFLIAFMIVGWIFSSSTDYQTDSTDKARRVLGKICGFLGRIVADDSVDCRWNRRSLPLVSSVVFCTWIPDFWHGHSARVPSHVRNGVLRADLGRGDFGVLPWLLPPVLVVQCGRRVLPVLVVVGLVASVWIPAGRL